MLTPMLRMSLHAHFTLWMKVQINVPENETTVNLKSASFIIIMHLPEGLTHIQSQIKPWLHFGESFTLSCVTRMLHCS